MSKGARASLIVAVCLLWACGRQPQLPVAAPDSIRQFGDGSVIGFADRYGTWSWLGIPYAAAPTGDLRWRAPRPAIPWQGVLEALSFAPICPQLPIPIVNDTDQSWLGDEDCLYLNVSAPQSWSPGDNPLPVMVWMHGGGNTVGSADLYAALRNLAAREQVITVAIQYRLGILGWFSHPALREEAANRLDSSGNFGTLDTIAALHWVQENIESFGGDADNVTVFGESAGGMNTFALLLSELADGLFHRAISQSGLLLTSPVAAAENTQDTLPPGSSNSSSELLFRLLVQDGAAGNREQAKQLLAGWTAARIMTYLRGKPAPQLLAQMRDSEMGLYPIPTLLRDGVVLPKGEPLAAIKAGKFNRVPVILGTNRDEMKTMMLRHPDYTKLRFWVFPRVVDQALFDRVTGHGSSMWKAVGADEPATAMVSAGHEDVFVYRFDWDDLPSNWLLDFRSLLGAGHGIEIPFVFYDIDNEMTYMPLDLIDDGNRRGAEPLARAISSYWGMFAHSGRPGTGRTGDLPLWRSWQEGQNFMIFDAREDAGIRLQAGGLERAGVFARLAGDQLALGGQAGVCQAYTHLFAEKNALFSFTTSCSRGERCPGAAGNFCP